MSPGFIRDQFTGNTWTRNLWDIATGIASQTVYRREAGAEYWNNETATYVHPCGTNHGKESVTHQLHDLFLPQAPGGRTCALSTARFVRLHGVVLVHFPSLLQALQSVAQLKRPIPSIAIFFMPEVSQGPSVVCRACTAEYLIYVCPQRFVAP